MTGRSIFCGGFLAVAWAFASIVGGAMAQAQSGIEIDVPQQELSKAIEMLSHQTGVPVAVLGQYVEGRTSNAVTGSMSAQQALRQMLYDEDLVVQEMSGGSLVVTRNTADFVSQNAQEGAFDLGTLVLQGELIERSLQDSQTSVSVTTGDDIDRRSETSIDTIARRVTGTQGRGFVIRGVRSIGVAGNTGNATISTSVDGVRFSDFAGADVSSIWDVEQVEVLRGPQSTQTGRNALFGAVNVETPDPTYTAERRIRAGIGQNGRYQAALVANTPLIEDQLALRFSFDRQETDGFFVNQAGTNDRVDFEDLLTIKAALRFDPTDQFSAVFRYTYIDDQTGNGFGENAFFPSRIANDERRFGQNINAFTLEMDYDLSDVLTLSSKSVITDAFTFQRSGGTPNQRTRLNRDRTFESLEQEFRLSFQNDRTRAVAGVFYTEIDRFIVNDVTSFLTPTTTFATTVIDEEARRNFAIFGEVEFELSPQWTFIAGARYDIEEFDAIASDSSFLNGAPIQVLGPAVFGTTFEAFLPKVGAVYSFTDDISLGLTYQRGYRAGGSGINLNSLKTFEFDPEFTDTIELAFRSQLNDGLVTLNGNVFYTDWTDQQVAFRRSNNPGDSVIDNVGSSYLWGAEANVLAKLTPDLDVFASATFTHTEFRNGIFAGRLLRGNEFPSAPEIVASVGASYTFGSGWQVGADVNYSDGSFGGAQNDPDQLTQDVWLVNLHASYEFSNGIRVSGFITNLFDEDYTERQTGSLGVAGESATIGPPREYGVFLEARF